MSCAGMAPCLLVVLDQPALWHLDAARGPSTSSFDYLVGAGEDARWNGEPQRRGDLEINDQLILGRCLYRQISRLLAPEDAIDVAGDLPVHIDCISPVG